jgi:transcriptional regulator with XRE-family HTH domain
MAKRARKKGAASVLVPNIRPMSEIERAHEVGQMIGARIRDQRKARRITLENLAKKTGFTRGYLSKIENSRKVPPIGSLARIAQALDLEIGLFFQTNALDQVDERVSLVRANERKHVSRGGSTFGYNYESVAHRKLHKHMEPFIFTYPANLSRDVWFEHEGEEIVFVLSGRVEFEAGGDRFILEPGDTLYLESEVPHRARSLGGEAKAFVVIFGHAH